MRMAVKVTRYQMRNLLRSRWLLGYTLLLGITTYGLFSFGGETSRVVLSLTNFVLGIVPLVSVLFGAIYLYNSEEFIELLLSQPISRKDAFRGLYFGVTLPLTLCFLLGAGIPLIAYSTGEIESVRAVALLLAIGILLTCTFSSFAFVIALLFHDKAKGLGWALLIWLFFGIIYDGVVLLTVMRFREYPLEVPLLILSFCNPLDMARIAMLLELDVSALMGYTGAVFEKTLASGWSGATPLLTIFAWNAVGYLLARSVFLRKDF